MFYKDSNQIYRVSELDRLGWLVHGFGTRHSGLPTEFPRLATVKQIHSATCVFAAGRAGLLGQGDALLENAPGAVVAIRTADCVPVLLVDERLRAVAAVHAGWRGTDQQIAPAAVEAMREIFGTRVEDMAAAIGPAIGQCCYEVGPEVAARFGESGRARIDLAAANRRQLVLAGVPPDRVYSSGLCTQCGVQDFHSFRRDKESAGRMFSFVGVR